MDSPYHISFSSFDSTPRRNTSRKLDISISDELSDLCEKIRVSSLTKAAEISPHVKEVTIGPNSVINKNKTIKTTDSENILTEESDAEDKVYEDKYSLLMKEYEKQIQNTANEYFHNLVNNLLHSQATMTKLWEKQGKDYEHKTLPSQTREMQLVKYCQENDNIHILECAHNDEKEYEIVNTRTIENVNRILEEQNRATARFAAITNSHTKICICKNEIFNILNTEPLGKLLWDKYMGAVNKVVDDISNTMNTCKTGAVNDKDVKDAEIYASNIEDIKKQVLESLNTLKAEELMKLQKEDELLKRQEEEKRIQEIKEAEATAAAAISEKIKIEQPKRTRPLFYSNKNYSYYEELKNYLENYEAQYSDLIQDVTKKKFRFDCQKAVNTPVNALSSVSAMHMRDKYDKLAKLLKGERVQVLDTYVEASQHPQGVAYCTALLAKKIVRQGDLLVSSNTEAAYPLAAITLALWAQFPQFGKLVEAYFHRLCPYLVPMLLPQKEGQADKDFYISRGYTYNDGVIEKQDKFLKRMSGIFRLQCAIWLAKMPKFLNVQHPQDLRYGWRWLASFINLKPEPDISATLLHDFYIMCGSTFYKFYGKQFTKILQLTSNQYLKILENIDEGGPKTRLEVYLQTVLQSNDVPSPPAPAQKINW